MLGPSRARQFGVDGFVAIWTEARLDGHSNQKIGIAVPPAIEQRTLINDVGVRGHRLPGSCDAIFERAIGRYLHHLSAITPQRFEMASFVFDPLLLKKHEVRIIGPDRIGFIEVSAVEKARVLASQEIDQVGRGKD